MKEFNANALPVLIGSLPMDDHEAAVRLVLKHTPQIPLWVQLPRYAEEGMITQFLAGLPGYNEAAGKNLIDTSSDRFDEEMIAFFEDYLALSDKDADLNPSRFALSGKRAQGFNEFLRQIDSSGRSFIGLKGQVTGPVTFGTAVKTQDDKDLFYQDQLMDAAVKKLALNARWQAKEFSKRGALPIVFIDEPVLAGFGTSAYITITREDVTRYIEEIAQEIHAENGLAGVHVCANTQWDILLDSTIDIISFDAFSYFDRFILYPENIKQFLGRGGIIAWGIVPTSKPEIIRQQTNNGLIKMLQDQIDELSLKTAVDVSAILSQSFITPSCGTGSIDFDSAKRVLELTSAVSAHFQDQLG